MVTDPEATAEVGDPRGPAELVAAARDERGETNDRLCLSVEVGELRADVHVDSDHVQPEVERLRDRGPGLGRGKAELRAVVAGADRLVRVRVDTQRDADERPPDSRRRGEHRLVRRVEDDCGVERRRGDEERVVLVVAVDDEIDTVEAGPLRERELARRGDVRADPLIAQQPQQRDVRQRLRPEEHASVADRVSERTRRRPDRVFAEDDERGAVLLRERVRREAAERQPRPVERAGVGEERQHAPIVPVSIGHVEQLLT